MMRRREFLIEAAAGTVGFVTSSRAVSSSQAEGPDPNFHVYLAFGQSNMEGFPGIEQQDKIDDAYGPLFGLPMSFIISRDGRICQKHLGLPGATKDTDPDAKTVKDIFESQIKALL